MDDTTKPKNTTNDTKNILYAKELQSNFLSIKSKMKKVESDLQTQINDLLEKERDWNEIENKAKSIDQNKIIRFNVSGTKFSTKIKTLLSVKDTIFYGLILTSNIDLNKEIFFDRSARLFSIILDFLRYKEFDLENLSYNEINDLLFEAEYFEIPPLIDFIGTKHIVHFVKLTGTSIMTGVDKKSKLDDGPESLHEYGSKTGIAVLSGGNIIVEFDKKIKIREIEFESYDDLSCKKDCTAGLIFTWENEAWKKVGAIPVKYYKQLNKVILK